MVAPLAPARQIASVAPAPVFETLVAEGVRTTDPSSCFDLPEATFVQDEEDQAHQHGSVTSSIRQDIV